MGGAQAHTLNALRFQAAENEVELVAGTDGPLVDACRNDGIDVTIIPMANRLLSPIADIRTLARLIAHFRRFRPDVVHTHSSKAGILGRVAAWLARTPIIVHTFHGPSFHDNQPSYARWALQMAERLCGLLSDGLIAVSPTTAAEFEAAGIRGPIAVVPSGIDFSRFPIQPFAGRSRLRSSLGVSEEDILVVSVAHLMPDKGHEVLIEAAREAAVAEPRLRFVVVGAGPLEKTLRSRIEQAGITQTVLLAGAREDVPEILAASDIFVQTSSREGLSRSLVEAMYGRVAVVATDVGSTRDVVDHEENGLLVPARDTGALCSGILKLARDNTLRQRLSENGHRAVESGRSVEAMGVALQEVYDQLAAKRGQRAGPASDLPHRRPQIVLVIDSLEIGGAERHLLRLAPMLALRGWDVVVYCLAKSGPLVIEMERHVRVIGGPRTASHFGALARFIDLHRFLWRERPDMLATYLDAPNILGSVAARLAGVRHVVTNRRGSHSHKGIKRLACPVAALIADRLCDRIVAVSRVTADEARLGKSAQKKLRIVRNSVPLAYTQRLPRQGDFESIRMGTVGRLAPDKGHKYLLEAMTQVIAQFPAARLSLIGDGDLRSDLEAQVRRLALGDHVTFLGARTDVPDLLRDLDLFVLPSLYEGMPNALIEAMATGIPVVATQTGAVGEVVDDGVTGILVPPADVQALASAITDLLGDPDRSQALGERGRESVLDKFGDPAREVDEMEAVYLELLGQELGFNPAPLAAETDADTAGAAAHEREAVSSGTTP